MCMTDPWAIHYRYRDCSAGEGVRPSPISDVAARAGVSTATVPRGTERVASVSTAASVAKLAGRGTAYIAVDRPSPGRTVMSSWSTPVSPPARRPHIWLPKATNGSATSPARPGENFCPIRVQHPPQPARSPQPVGLMAERARRAASRSGEWCADLRHSPTPARRHRRRSRDRELVRAAPVNEWLTSGPAVHGLGEWPESGKAAPRRPCSTVTLGPARL